MQFFLRNCVLSLFSFLVRCNRKHFLGNNENFLSIVSKLYDKEFEHFKEILNLYLNDGNNIKKIKKDTVYKNYELGKKFYTYRYKEKYFEYFEKFGLTVKKYNQKELFMYKIDLLSECIKNNIGTGKGLVYKGENVGEWYRNQRKSFRKGKLSEYKIKEFYKRNIPLDIEEIA